MGGGTISVLSVTEIISVILLIILYIKKDIIPVDFRVISWEIPTTIFLYCVVYGKKEKFNFLLGKIPLRFVGNISMEIYLFHYPVLNIIELIGIGGGMGFVLIICITMLIAVFLYKLNSRGFFSA